MAEEHSYSIIEGDHDTESGEALRRGWCHKHGNKARLMRPKRGKAAQRAEIQGQGADVHRGRNVFKRCARIETWDPYVRAHRKECHSRGSALRKSGKETVSVTPKSYRFDPLPLSKALSIEEVEQAKLDARPHVNLSVDQYAGGNANNVEIDTSPWEVAVARADRAAELYVLHVQSHGKPQPEVKPIQRPLPRQKPLGKQMRSDRSRPKRVAESEETITLHQRRRPNVSNWEEIKMMKHFEAELKQARQLRQNGFTNKQLDKIRGLRPGILREVGFSARELSDVGLSMRTLVREGFTARQLIDENDFTPTQVLDAGYSLGELLEAELGVAQLLTRFTARELLHAGFNASELRKAGLTARPLREAGFTAPQLRDAGFTYMQLCKVGFTFMQQLREVGRAASTVAELRDAGFTAIELQAAGYTPAELSSLFELLTIHAGSQGADGLVVVSCFNVGGLDVATVRINIGARLCELLEAIEKEVGRSVMFLLPDGRVVTPHDAAQPVHHFLSD